MWSFDRVFTDGTLRASRLQREHNEPGRRFDTNPVHNTSLSVKRPGKSGRRRGVRLRHEKRVLVSSPEVNPDTIEIANG